MFLAIDIGNTSISFGLFEEDKLIKDFRIPTHPVEEISLSKTFVRERIKKDEVSKILIGSVVPHINLKFKKEIENYFKISPLIIGKDISVPIKNLYKNPEKVGCDRLLNAYAGKLLYGQPLIIVDFGTAITFDILSKKGHYLGGIISPGIEISRDVLFQRTALLPKIRLKRPRDLIGRTTQESILSGLFFGFGSLVDGLIEKLKLTPALCTKPKLKLRQDNIRVIATGGNAKLLAPFCRAIDKIDPYLTLKGILFLSKRTKNY